MARRFSATYEATPESVSVVRNQMAALAADCGLDEQKVADVKLAVSEAATNALLHAYRDSERGTIRVEAEIQDGELIIAIRDSGAGIRPRPDSPGLGLGLPVIAALSERFEIGPTAGEAGTSLRMAFGCPQADSAFA